MNYLTDLDDKLKDDKVMKKTMYFKPKGYETDEAMNELSSIECLRSGGHDIRQY